MAFAGAVLAASVAAACTSIAHSASNQANFTITNTISSSATSPDAGPPLPRRPRYLWYTAHNPLKVPITVRTMSISSVTATARLHSLQPRLRRDHLHWLPRRAGTGHKLRVRFRFRSWRPTRIKIRVKSSSLSSLSRVRRLQHRHVDPDRLSSSHDPSVIGQSGHLHRHRHFR